eukprot:416316-Rhodomonas_salina.2
MARCTVSCRLSCRLAPYGGEAGRNRDEKRLESTGVRRSASFTNGAISVPSSRSRAGHFGNAASRALKGVSTLLARFRPICMRLARFCNVISSGALLRRSAIAEI